MRLSGATPFTGLETGNSGTVASSPANGLLVANTWYHVASVFTGGTATIYLNGVQVGAGASPLLANSDPLRIGVDFLARYFNGQIDEVRVWNTAVSPSTLNDWKNLGVSSTHPNYANLKAYFNFDEPSGTTVYDQSGNGNNGTIVNGASRIPSGVTLAPAGSYSWSPATDLSATNIYNPVCTPTASLATTVYTVTYTDAAGCSATATATVNTLDAPSVPTSAGSTQCGVGIPGAKVSSTTPGVAFNWYLTPTGGAPIQSALVDSLTSYSILNSTTFYVSALDLGSGCESSRAEVIANVFQPDSIVATPSQLNVCLGSTVTLIATNLGTTNNYVYTWNGPGVVNVVEDTITISHSTLGTYNYTVTGVDGLCTKIATTSFNVVEIPNINIIPPTSTTVCGGTSINATAQNALISAGNINIGTNNSSTKINTTGTPYRTGSTLNNSLRNQYLVFASELLAAGIYPGNITSIGFFVTTGTTGVMSNNVFKIGHTAATAMTTTYLTDPMTTVLNLPTYTPVLGLNNHTFTTPFVWDGVSNIVVEICGQLTTTGSGTTIETFNTPVQTTVANSLASGACTALTGSFPSTTVLMRPVMRFGAQTVIFGNSLNWSWSNGTSVVSTISTLTDIPLTTTTYTVTGTNPISGCSASDSVTVTVNPTPDAPTSAGSSQCGAGIPSAKVASTTPGVAFNWYTDAVGGTLIQSALVDSLQSYSVTSTATLYVSSLNIITNCESARTPVLIDVIQPDTIIASVAPNPVCPGTSVTLTATNPGTTNTYTYTWNGTGVVAQVGANITFTAPAAGTYVYSVTGVDGLCTKISTTTLTVIPPPVISSATASPNTAVCAGSPVTLTGLTPTVGSGNRIFNDSAATSTIYSSPFYSAWSNKNQQILLLASELTAAGILPGNLTGIDFSITSGTVALVNFSLSLAQTSQTTMAAPLASGAFTNVYSAASQPQIIGTNNIPFSTPFNWDGISNIVVKICFGNSATTATLSSGARMSTTTYVSQYVSYNTAATDGNAICPSTGTTVVTYSTRPTMRLYGQTIIPGAGTVNWSWNDGISNIATTNSTVVNPLTTTTYTVTAQDPTTLCSSTANVTVNVNPLPSSPTVTNSSQCGTAIPTASVATSNGSSLPQFKWYDAPSGGTLVQDIPPATGALTNYYSNDFSGGSNGASITGNATITGGALQLTASIASQLGAITIPASGINADKYNVAFNLITSGGGGADGTSYSFGDDISGTSTTVNGEFGSGTKLKISFDDFGTGTAAAGIYVFYNSSTNTPGQTVGANGVLAYSSDVSWLGNNVPVVVDINAAGQLTLTVNSVVIFSNVQLPAGYLSADKSNWAHGFKARTGGSFMIHSIDDIVIQQSSNVSGYFTYQNSIATTTSWYVSEVDALTGCESTRSEVIASVVSSDSVAISTLNDTICLGQSTTLIAANTGTTNNYTYTWNGDAGSGVIAGTPGASLLVVPSTSGNHVITVNAIDGLCSYTNSFTIYVSPLPEITSVTANATTVCASSPVIITALTPTIGAGNRVLNDSSSTSATYSNPFYSNWSNKRQQILYTAAELNASGIYAGNITALEFSLTAGTAALTNFSLSLAHTNATNMTSLITTGFSTVYASATETPVIGSKLITFSTPFAWDGVSNLVIQLCSGNPSSTVTISGTAKMSATTFVSQYETHNTASTDGNVICGATGTAVNTYSTRPTMRLYGQTVIQGAGSLNWTWTDGVSTVGTGNIITVNPTETTTFIVTAMDNLTGCSNTDSITINVNPNPSAPTAVDGTRCGFGLANVGATSTSGVATPILSWYTTPTGGTPIQTGPSTTLDGYNVSATTTFYVGEINPLTSCVSLPRTPVVQTVTPADTLVITGGISSLCLGESINFGSTQIGSTNTYGLTWTASPAIGSGLPTGPLGPVQTWYTNDFSVDAGTAAINGNASLTGGVLQLNPNAVSQFGGVTIPNSSSISVDAFTVDFDLTLTQIGVDGADGLSYSFGDDVSATATTPNAENGTGTKLKVSFDSYGGAGAGQAGIYLMYNCNVTNQTPTTSGVLAYVPNTTFVNTTSHVTITVDQNGLATVSLNGTPVISGVALPSSYLLANRSTWQHVIKARTGAISQLHAIDNLVINYQTITSTPVTGPSVSVTPTIPGTYVYTLTGVDGDCGYQTSYSVLVNPAAAAISAGVDFSSCEGSSVTLNASGAGLIPTLRLTELGVQSFLTTGGYNGVQPSWFPAAGISSGNDLIEITNLGLAPTLPGGTTFEIWTSSTATAPAKSFTIPTNASALASGASLFIQWGSPATNDLVNNYYSLADGAYDQYTSSTAYGYIIKKGGQIIDAVGTNGFSFPVVSGVTAADWSGAIASSSGQSGTTLIANDNNTASSWRPTETGTFPTSYGLLNPGVTADLPALGAVNWTSIPAGFTATTASATFGPLTSSTQFVVEFDNGTCQSYDTVNVTVITTLPTPLVTASVDTICTIGSSTFTITNPTTTASYQWLESTSPTGPWTPISGATSNSYTTPIMAPIVGDSILYFRVTGVCGSSLDTSVVRTLFLAKPFVTSSSSVSRCGAGMVTLTAVGNGTIEWYTLGTGGTLLGTGSPFNINVASTSIYFAGSAVGTCKSPSRSASAITINPSTEITANATPTEVCLGQSTVISAASTNVNYVYSWNGFTQGTSQTVSPTTSTIYTVFAVDTVDGCGASASILVNVNPIPSTPEITTSGSVACAGTSTNLTATSSGPGTAVIGTANGVTTISTTGTPYRTGTTLNNQQRNQYLVFASELTAAGIVAGNITSLGFTVTTATPTGVMSNNTFSIGHTSATALTTTYLSIPMTQVLTIPTYTPINGLNNHTFTTAFNWDGTSNILIEICGQMTTSGSGTALATFTTPVQTTVANTSATGCVGTTGSYPSTVNFVRPVLTFGANVSSSGASTFNWSTGQTGSTVSVTPLPGTNTYTVTATSAAGCTSAPGSITITPSALPTPTVTDSLGNPVLTGTVFCSPSSVDLYANDLTGPYAAGYPAGTTVEWLGYGISGHPDSTFVNSGAGSTFQARITLGGSGCIGLSNSIIVDSRSVTLTDVIVPAACGNTNGSITVNVSTAPNPPYRYVWTGPSGLISDITTSSLTSTITGLAGGTYTLDIYDNVGGSLSCSTLGLTYEVTASTGADVNADSTNVTCFGLTDGTATATVVSGGTAPFSYLWSTSGTTETITGLSAGIYTVTVTDGLGCTSTATTEVLMPTEITAVVTSTNACFGQSNGTASVVISGGTGNYTTIDWYSLDFATQYNTPGTPALSVSGLPAGTLSLVIVDDAGCSPVTGILVGPSILNPVIVENAEIVVASFAPTSGAIGSSVVITGSGFTGATGVSFNGTPATVYTVDSDIQITATVPAGATTGTVTVQVGSCSGTSSGSFTVISTGTLNLKAYIQGYLDVATTTMATVILNQTGLGLSTETDNITVEFHDATAPYATVSSTPVMLNTDGTAIVTIPGSLIGGSYYIVILHRSALETWSANPVTLTTVTNYDFTTSSSQAFGDNMVEGPTGVWSLYNGDVDNGIASGSQDGSCDGSDFLYQDTDIQNFNAGYLGTDLNGDGGVDGTDFLILDANIQNFIGTAKP